jgi:hypothetical protein
MDTDQLRSFGLLKQKVQLEAANKLGIEKALTDWSLQDIRDFQADLEAVCKSSVSEKWVYTHFKRDSSKLPRIDVLNLLSEWVGCKNWDDFVRKHGAPPSGKKANRKRTRWLLLPSILLFAVLAWFFFPKGGDMIIAFKDAYTQSPVAMNELTLKINNRSLTKNRISTHHFGDSLVADGPYYKRKKVWLPTNPGDTLFVELLPDDYALMLNFFSRSTADDLDKRRLQLSEAIHPEAKIFQSHPQYEGIELLNREEFIDRLILPINSLKNLEIQHIIYRDDKIYRLQFLQKSDENEPH